MKLSRFLFVISFVTGFCLLYVYQQSEIFRLAYSGQKRVGKFEDLLDRNAVLKYNIAKNSSLTRIGNRICANSDFQMPDTYKLMRMAQPANNPKLKQYAQNKESFIWRLFGVKRQAEAKTLNP